MARFSLPFVGNVVSRELGLRTSNNLIRRTRNDVIGVLEDKLRSYSKEGSVGTIADVIAAALNELLGDILEAGGIFVTYYEHGETSAIQTNYSETKDIKSLMWTFPFCEYQLCTGFLTNIIAYEATLSVPYV